MKSPSPATTAQSTAEIIDIGSPIADKVSKVGANSPYAPSIEAANKQLAAMAVDYEQQLWGELNALESEIDRILTLPMAERAGEMPPFYEAVVNIKGQAGSFNYALITMIADTLRKFLQGGERIKDHELTNIRQYLALIQVVLEQQLNGAEGQAAQKVISALDRLGEAVA